MGISNRGKPFGMRLPPGAVASGRTGDLLASTIREQLGHLRHPAYCLLASRSRFTKRSRCCPSLVQAVANPSRIRVSSMLIWLRPLSPSLIPAGGPLERTLADTNWVRAVSISPDGNWAVSGSQDHLFTMTRRSEWEPKEGGEDLAARRDDFGEPIDHRVTAPTSN